MPPKQEVRKFDVGTSVLAKWPKTTLYYKGEIIDFNDVEYLIRFDDEDHSELPIKYKDTMLPLERSRSRSRGRTPTRSQNKKSPSRKSATSKTSPSRKSPGRPKRSLESTSVSPKPKAENSKQVEEKLVEEKKEVSTSVRSRAPTRQSLRIAEKPKVDGLPSNNMKVDVKAITKSVEEQSNFKQYIYRAGKLIRASLQTTPIVVMVVFLSFILNQMCSKNKCSIRDLPDIPKKLQYYYDQKALAITGIYFVSILLLSLVPLGKIMKTKSGANVRCNGFLSLVVLCGIIPVLQKFKYDITSLYTFYRQFLVTFTALGILLALVLYIKSYYSKKEDINPRAKTGYWVPDFVEGREIHPRVWNIDIKFLLFRSSLLFLLLVNIILVLKQIQSPTGGYSPTLLVASAFQILYVLDLIFFEECYFTTFDYKNQGTGLLVCAGYLNLPFFMAIFPRYVFNHRSELPWYCLVGIATFYVVGYIILRGSTSQKHAFRTNPSDPALAHLESLPTSAGNRLLVSGWWGLVRHPNYLGGLIIQLSMAFICGFNHAIPWVVYGISMLYLLVRLYSVESYCKQKYGLGWASYTSRVKYRIIPKVF